MVDAYPVVTNLADAFFVFLTVIAMGLIAVLYPIRYIRKNALN